MEVVTDFLFLGPKITADGDGNRETRRQLLLGRKAVRKWRQCVKKQGHHFANKGLHSQGYGLSGSHAWMRELDHKEGRVPKNWCLRTVVLEKIPQSPLDSKEIKPVNLKGSQPWILVERTDAEAESPVFWSSDVNGRCEWLLRMSLEKSLMLGKTEGRRRRGGQRMRSGWHHQCNGHELGQASGDGEGQGGLVWCSPWGLSQTWLGNWATTTVQNHVNHPKEICK